MKHGAGDVDAILTLWRLQVSLKFHGVGIFISPNLVETPSQFEVPWGWEV